MIKHLAMSRNDLIDLAISLDMFRVNKLCDGNCAACELGVSPVFGCNPKCAAEVIRDYVNSRC